MAQENPLWGQVRIMAELLKLGCLVSPRTVRKYMRRPWKGPPSPRWRAFLTQHAQDIWACDFLGVRSVTFQTLYVFFLIRHDTREIAHLRVTRHPTAAWTGQQLTNACFDREPPRYLIRDRDSIYGLECARRAASLGIREIRTPVRAPKANAIAERFVGTLRRECLDHVFVFNEEHLQKILRSAAALSKHLARPCAKCLRSRGVFLAPTALRLGSATMALRWVPYPAIGGFSPALRYPWLGG